jgi:hypothetical protein
MLQNTHEMLLRDSETSCPLFNVGGWLRPHVCWCPESHLRSARFPLEVELFQVPCGLHWGLHYSSLSPNIFYSSQRGLLLGMSGVAQRHNTSSTRPAKMASNQSLNHLLNFSLPPRQPNPLPRRSRKTTGAAVWNKERESAPMEFISTSDTIQPRVCQCTVSVRDEPSRGLHCTLCRSRHVGITFLYRVEAYRRRFFQWNDILQVIIPRSSALASTTNDLSSSEEGHTTCPICLSPPTAPRMTKCGHVSL